MLSLNFRNPELLELKCHLLDKVLRWQIFHLLRNSSLLALIPLLNPCSNLSIRHVQLTVEWAITIAHKSDPGVKIAIQFPGEPMRF